VAGGPVNVTVGKAAAVKYPDVVSVRWADEEMAVT
jgi:hypothetical protein